MTSLDPEFIKQLLLEDAKEQEPKYPVPPQRGPLRYSDYEMRCTKLRCGSATYIKVDGIPRCLTHALQDLNELCLKLTDEKEELIKSRPVMAGDLFN